MSDIKWIKVAVDMFEDSKIEFIRSLPEGDSIIVTWIQMLSIAGKSNMGGYLLVAEGIPYTEQFLCDKLRRTPTFMQFALDTLIKLKMVNVEDGPFHITNWEKHQNVMGMDKVREQTRLRVAKHREKQQLLLENGQCNVTSSVTSNDEVTHSNAIELRTKNKNKEKHNTFSAYTSNIALITSLESFIEFRKKIKKPMTDRAITLLLGKLDKLSTSDEEKIAILDQSVFEGWQGIFPLKQPSGSSQVGRTGQAAYTRGIVKPDNPIRTAEENEWFDKYAYGGKRTDA